MVSKPLLATLTFLLFSGCLPPSYSKDEPALETESYFIDIKYRDDDVNVLGDNFEYLSTEGSSLVDDAWFDESNSYMIIGLDGTYYHYCSLPSATWELFKTAPSFGTYYASYIKGHYDCRYNYMPIY